MKRYDFEVQSIHPPQFMPLFHDLFDKEKAKGNLHHRHVIKEIGKACSISPGLISEFVVVSAATLTIIKHLYDFYKEIKSKKGKVYITIDGERLDLEAYNLDELKAKISQKSAEG